MNMSSCSNSWEVLMHTENVSRTHMRKVSSEVDSSSIMFVRGNGFQSPSKWIGESSISEFGEKDAVEVEWYLGTGIGMGWIIYTHLSAFRFRLGSANRWFSSCWAVFRPLLRPMTTDYPILDWKNSRTQRKEFRLFTALKGLEHFSIVCREGYWYVKQVTRSYGY